MIWDIPSGKLHVPPLIGHIMGVSRTIFTPDAKVLMTSGSDHTVRMWHVDTGNEMLLFNDCVSVSLGDEGNTLLLQKRVGGAKDFTELITIPTLAEIDQQEQNAQSTFN